MTDINAYKKRLEAVNCKEVTYLPISQHKMFLGDKWKLMADNAKGAYYILQSSDCYSQPYRLKETYDLFKQGYDWVQSKKGIFYDLKIKKEILYDWSLSNGHPCGLNMAVKTELAKMLKNNAPHKSIDTWFKKSCIKIKPDFKTGWNESNNWIYGVDTNGANKISNRSGYFSNPTPPYASVEIKINECVPPDILNRLNEIQP